MTFFMKYPSPIGDLTLLSTCQGLCGVWFEGQKYYMDGAAPGIPGMDDPILTAAARWLDIYFTGDDPGAPPPLDLRGSEYRKLIWDILLTIPYGSTATYGDVAREAERRSGRHTWARAVGGAVGHNPVSIIVPCHRVVGAGGSLTGYAGGLQRKEYLLRLEHTSQQNVFPANR